MFLRLVVALLLCAACGGEGNSAFGVEPAPLESTARAADTSAPVLEPPDSTSTIATSSPATPPTTTATDGYVRVAEFDDAGWFVVNDGVMGGRSDGRGVLDRGVLTWTGTIVTAGGGFSSIRGPVDAALAGATALTMRIRTDGRPYELLADDARPGRVTHYRPIEATGGVWEEVTVPLRDMEARIFGTPVTALPFDPAMAIQIGVILADGVDGDFLFEIDWIAACP